MSTLDAKNPAPTSFDELSKRGVSELDEILEFERGLSEIAAVLIAQPANRIDDAIEDSLRRVVGLLDVDRATLAQQRADGGSFRLTHSWAAAGFEKMPAFDASRLFPFARATVRRGEPFVFESLDHLPPEAEVDRQTFAEVGLKSHVSLRLHAAGQMIGALSVGTLRKERLWPSRLIQRLELLAQVFANAISRKRADLELQAAHSEVSRLSQRLIAENVYLREEIKQGHDFEEIVGNSEALRQALHRVDQVAPTEASVLIMGETGTGKELIARAIHARSPRRQRPLVKVNCAALPSELIESELFGHEKGAFTGALTKRTGRFELADGGTIFLDEVGEMRADLQTKLLRVLQDGKLERIGSARTLRVDVRVIAATNRDLEQAMAEGRFRTDLFYRLAVFPVDLPPLRARAGDVPLLVWHFVTKHQVELGKRIEEIPQAVMDRLCRYRWPGNVRELENLVERSVILSSGPTLEIDALFLTPAQESVEAPADDSLEKVERAHILRVVEECGWQIRGPGKAAERLALNESTLRYRMKKLGIRRPGSRPAKA